MTIVDKILEKAPNPKMVGQSEYSAIHDFFSNLAGDEEIDADLVEAMLQELRESVQTFEDLFNQVRAKA